mmetsp:Transcript_19423/g.55707  ORF Transcript_19423/g.55707 Transcript_19423/m.55707 type:complete len:87 (-) Transcript_19423:1887-2147(-)
MRGEGEDRCLWVFVCVVKWLIAFTYMEWNGMDVTVLPLDTCLHIHQLLTVHECIDWSMNVCMREVMTSRFPTPQAIITHQSTPSSR